MIIKHQKPIKFVNLCNCVVDYITLEKAVIWYSDKPVRQRKSIYMYGRYPAVSIYDKKLHVHRLLMMYWLNRDLEPEEIIHHKDGNILNLNQRNLIVMPQGNHARLHLSHRKQEPEFVKRRIAASVVKRWPQHETPELLDGKE